LYPVGYFFPVIALRQTPEFDRWIAGLRDREAILRIRTRIHRLTQGNEGDYKPIGEGVRELRIHHGPGFRVYYAKRGLEYVLLLAGGNKSSQQKDIRLALKLARES
jgi:putative addiction module killer protein